MPSKYLTKLNLEKSELNFYSIKSIEKELSFCSVFPYAYRVLVENILRNNSSEKKLKKKLRYYIIVLREKMFWRN